MRRFFFCIWMVAPAAICGSGVLAADKDGPSRGLSLRRPRLRRVETQVWQRTARQRLPVLGKREETGMSRAPSEPVLAPGTSALLRSAASLIITAREQAFSKSPVEFMKTYLQVQRNVVKALLGSDEGDAKPEVRSLSLAISSLMEAHSLMPAKLLGAPPEDPITAEVVRSVVHACTYFWQLAELTWPQVFKRKDASSPGTSYRLRLKSPADFLKALRASTHNVLSEKVLSKLQKAINNFSSIEWDRASIDFLAYELRAVWEAYERPTTRSLETVDLPE